MTTKHENRSISAAPVHRCCALCGQHKTIYPMNDEHRKAHLSRQIAFVCSECAARVRMEVEAAGSVVNEPKVSA